MFSKVVCEFGRQGRLDHRIEALAVVVDDPPGVFDAVLPAVYEGFVDVSLIEFGIADKRDHATLRPIRAPILGVDIILHQARERCHCNAETDRAGRKINVIDVLGAGRVGLSALESPEAFQFFQCLIAEQILDGMEHRARMRLDGDTVFGPQDRKVQCGHDGGERGAGRLMAANLEAISVWPFVVGMMNDLCRKPKDLALKLAQHGDIGC